MGWTRRLIRWTLLVFLAARVEGAPPPNDTCVNAEVITGLGLTTLIPDISEATETGDPISSCLDTTHMIWYRFTPAMTAEYVLSTAADTGTTVEDTVLSVYTSTGGCGGEMEELDCNDDEAGLRAALAVQLEAGATYYIVIGVASELSPEAAAVQLRVSIPMSPGNDDCSVAEVIPSDSTFPYFTEVTDTTLAGSEGDPSVSCAPVTARGVWYQFAPAESSIYEFSTCEDSGTTVYDTLVAIFTSENGCAGPLTEVACDDSGCGERGRVSAAMEGGRMYYIFVAEGFPGTPESPILGETYVQLRVDRFSRPSVTTSPPSSISSNGAQLNAVVNPSGVLTTFWFEWGATTNYGNRTSDLPAGDANFPGARSAVVGVDGPNIYHYRVGATNALGASYGGDQVFQWNGSPPSSLELIRVDGVRRLLFRGITRQVYWIEASIDLRDWVLIGSAAETSSGFFELDDTSAAGTARFYRALAP